MSLSILAGKFKNQKLYSIKSIRPATALVKNAIFNICQNFIENARFLDIFSGSGAIGLEALSRGAKSSTFIDLSFSSIQVIKKNIHKLKVEDQTKMIQKDAIKALDLLEPAFDIITIDPPFIMYTKDPYYINKLLFLLNFKKLITKDSVIFLEEPFYSKRDPNIDNLTLQNKRKYGSCYLLEYRNC
jgi:16S rRNA (guanine966-N2)-methyltransferase